MLAIEVCRYLLCRRDENEMVESSELTIVDEKETINEKKETINNTLNEVGSFNNNNNLDIEIAED